MIPVNMSLTVVAETAFSIGAGGSAETLADTHIVRDGWGRPIIPGSQVKGRIRHTAEAIARSLGLTVQEDFYDDESPDNIIRALFGSPKQQSPLYFADLIGDVPYTRQHYSQVRPSVSVNRRRGVVEDTRLLFQETTLEGMQFCADNAITGTLPQESYIALLWVALSLTTRWGGAKSRGLGWARVHMDIVCNEKHLSKDDLEHHFRNLVK